MVNVKLLKIDKLVTNKYNLRKIRIILQDSESIRYVPEPEPRKKQSYVISQSILGIPTPETKSHWNILSAFRTG